MQDFKITVKIFIRKTGKSILFFVILTAMLIGLSGQIEALSQKDDSLIQSRNKSIVKLQKEEEDTIDVLVLGDSLAYTSISPMQLWEGSGMTVFVGSQSCQKIQESYYMLKTAFDSQRPKLVILETNVIFRGQDGLGGITDALYEKGNYYFPVFRFHDIWKPLLMGTKYAEESYKGFMIRDSVEPYSGKKYMKETRKEKPISDTVRMYLDMIIEMCRENDAELLLVSTPSPVNYNYQKHNTLTEYAKEKGLRYVDMNLDLKEAGIDWQTDSLDRGDHLNLSGARKVTRYLENYLNSNYNLPDHRKEKEYEEWQKESDLYQKEITKRLKKMNVAD